MAKAKNLGPGTKKIGAGRMIRPAPIGRYCS